MRTTSPLLGITVRFLQKCNLEEINILYNILYLRPEKEWDENDLSILKNIILYLSQFTPEKNIIELINKIVSKSNKLEILLFLSENLDIKTKKEFLNTIESLCVLIITEESYYLSIKRNYLLLNYLRIFRLHNKLDSITQKQELYFNLINTVRIRRESIVDYTFLLVYENARKINHDINIQFQSFVNNLTDSEIKIKHADLIIPIFDLLFIHYFTSPALVKKLLIIVFDRILKIKEPSVREVQFYKNLRHLRKTGSLCLPNKYLIKLLKNGIIESPETLLEIYITLMYTVKDEDLDVYSVKVKSCIADISDNVVKEFRRIDFGKVLLTRNRFNEANKLINEFEENIAKKSFLGISLNHFTFSENYSCGFTIFQGFQNFEIIKLPFPYSTDNTLRHTKLNIRLDISRAEDYYKSNIINPL
jgi:hypothetical protein